MNNPYESTSLPSPFDLAQVLEHPDPDVRYEGLRTILERVRDEPAFTDYLQYLPYLTDCLESETDNAIREVAILFVSHIAGIATDQERRDCFAAVIPALDKLLTCENLAGWAAWTMVALEPRYTSARLAEIASFARFSAWNLPYQISSWRSEMTNTLLRQSKSAGRWHAKSSKGRATASGVSSCKRSPPPLKTAC